MLLAPHLGFLHEDGDTDQVVVGHGVVDDALPLGHDTDGAQANVGPPVVKLANKSVPVASLVGLSVTIRGDVELVFDADCMAQLIINNMNFTVKMFQFYFKSTISNYIPT